MDMSAWNEHYRMSAHHDRKDHERSEEYRRHMRESADRLLSIGRVRS